MCIGIYEALAINSGDKTGEDVVTVLTADTVDPVACSWLREGYVRSVHTKKWLQ
jgi:hypothetical protein